MALKKLFAVWFDQIQHATLKIPLPEAPYLQRACMLETRLQRTLNLALEILLRNT
jgi:hypothetical protein